VRVERQAQVALTGIAGWRHRCLGAFAFDLQDSPGLKIPLVQEGTKRGGRPPGTGTEATAQIAPLFPDPRAGSASTGQAPTVGQVPRPQAGRHGVFGGELCTPRVRGRVQASAQSVRTRFSHIPAPSGVGLVNAWTSPVSQRVAPAVHRSRRPAWPPLQAWHRQRSSEPLAQFPPGRVGAAYKTDEDVCRDGRCLAR